MGSLAPRAVLVTRQTEYERLLAQHATRGQVAFYLESRGQSLETLELRHDRQRDALDTAKRAVPPDWSFVHVLREDLDRVLFTPDAIVVAVGQDGLVANVAKYLDGQPVVGVTPEERAGEGVLTAMPAAILPELLPAVAARATRLQKRTMVEASIGEGQSLCALNELFVGHRSHQSARYLLRYDGREEAQSSSGVIVSTGTGLSGWARSILSATHRHVAFAPEERHAVFFAREPWPSNTTGCDLAFGDLGESQALSIVSRLESGGVIFADGIEQDYLRFDWGLEAEIALSNRTLNLVAPVQRPCLSAGFWILSNCVVAPSRVAAASK